MEDGIEDEKIQQQSTETGKATVEENVPGLMPGLEHGHGHEHKTGIPWLDGIIAVSVIFISLLSLAVSIEHGRTMAKMVDQNQKLVVASTLPLLSVYGNNYDPATKKPYSGFGARVRCRVLRVAPRDWSDQPLGDVAQTEAVALGEARPAPPSRAVGG